MAGRSAHLTRLVGLLFGVPLIWGLFLSGATGTSTRYLMFLLLLVPALIAVLARPQVLGGGLSALPLYLCGAYLLAQTALQPTLEGWGYVHASLGWLALYLTLWLTAGERSAGTTLLLVLVLLGGLEALYGLMQSIIGVDFVWSNFGAEDRRARGTFVYHNNFAGLLNMTLSLTLGVISTRLSRLGLQRRSEQHARAWLLLLCCALMGLAIILARSRGGSITLILTLAFIAALLTLRRRSTGEGGLSARLTLVLILMIVGLGSALGLEGLREKFSRLPDETRPAIYADSLRLIADHASSGVGPGMYAWRIRPYQTAQVESQYRHAHNDYLEVAAEWGVPAAVLFWGFVLWRFVSAARWYLRTTDLARSGVALGCSGAMFSILVHSLVDFNLHIPINLMVFFTIVGLAWGVERHGGSAARAFPREGG